jgi:hypothetical protein
VDVWEVVVVRGGGVVAACGSRGTHGRSSSVGGRSACMGSLLCVRRGRHRLWVPDHDSWAPGCRSQLGSLFVGLVAVLISPPQSPAGLTGILRNPEES